MLADGDPSADIETEVETFSDGEAIGQDGCVLVDTDVDVWKLAKGDCSMLGDTEITAVETVVDDVIEVNDAAALTLSVADANTVPTGKLDAVAIMLADGDDVSVALPVLSVDGAASVDSLAFGTAAEEEALGAAAEEALGVGNGDTRALASKEGDAVTELPIEGSGETTSGAELADGSEDGSVTGFEGV